MHVRPWNPGAAGPRDCRASPAERGVSGGRARSPGCPRVLALVDVQTADSLVQGAQDRGLVLGEQMPVDVLGRLDPAVPIWRATCMSDAPEAISSDAQTWRSSCAVQLTIPSR